MAYVIGNSYNDSAVAQNSAQVANSLNNMANIANGYSDDVGNYLSMAMSAQSRADQFNAEQAKLQRDWSESMSATAHQREVADLRAAGLNPVISAYGSGASVGSGASASSTNQLTSAFVGLAGQAISAVSNLAQAISTNSTSFANTVQSATAQQYAADRSYSASLYSANQSYNAQTFAANLASKTSLSVNQATNQMNWNIAKLNSMTSQEVATIAGEYGIAKEKLSNIVSQYASELAYQAAIYQANRAYDTQAMVQMQQRLTQQYTTLEGQAGSLLSTIIGGLLRRK